MYFCGFALNKSSIKFAFSCIVVAIIFPYLNNQIKDIKINKNRAKQISKSEHRKENIEKRESKRTSKRTLKRTSKRTSKSEHRIGKYEYAKYIEKRI
jgi:hypothetical protein